MTTSIQNCKMAKIRYLNKVYSKVLKKFKSIGLEEINFVYSQDVDKYASLSVGEYETFMVLGRRFLGLGKDKMRAVIAHELGHYERVRRYSCDNFIITNLRDEELIGYVKRGYSEACKHRFERLKKWLLLHEIDADNKALKAGYGKGMLNVLALFKNSGEYQCMPDILKEQINARIKNLEGKLGL